MDSLIDRASITLLTGAAVRAFASAAAPADIRQAILPALRTRGPHAATVLAFALAASGEPLPREALLELIPDLSSIEHLAPLVGASEGDRVALLLDLVDSGRASAEREALALYLATQLMDAEPPPRLIRQLRALARQALSPDAAGVLSLAARVVDDPGLTTLLAPRLCDADDPGLHTLAKGLRAPLFAPALDALPEREPPRVLGGHTVVRPAPKVGRNDPCPCGSGRKYKKCCEGKPLTADSQSVLEQFEALDDRQAGLRDQLFELLRPADLAQVDRERLTALQLVRGMRTLVQHRRWELAERFLDRLKQRPDVPAGPEHAHEYHFEIADEALAAGELALAERHFEQAQPDEQEREHIRARLALARRDPDAMACIEAMLVRALRDDDTGTAIDLAYDLLDHMPAVGIVVARGCLTPNRQFDSAMLLQQIERARDRLGLDPKEPWRDVYDQLTGNVDAPPDPPQKAIDPREHMRLSGEVQRLRREFRQVTSERRRLDDELRKRMQELDRLTAERDRHAQQRDAEPETDHRVRAAELAAERLRLRAKIEELKGEIAAGSSQRAELRRELARLSEARSTPQRAPHPPEPDAQEDDDAGEAACGVPRSVLVPTYSAAAARALALLPRQVAAQALQAVAALAAGEERLWSGVKRMRATQDVYSARVGRDYRILFQTADHRLEVANIIDRKDLDASLERLSR